MNPSSRIPIGLFVIYVCAIALSACSTSAKEYTDLSQAGTLSQQLCFRVEHLPRDFEIVARIMQDNRLAAVDSPHPNERETEYREWGRVIGSFNHWAYEPPSMPDEDADGRMSDEEIEQELHAAAIEVLNAPFRTATCSVSVYSTETGAGNAFHGELEDLRNPSHLAYVSVTDVDVVSEPTDRAIAVHKYEAPSISKFIVLLRHGNVLGEVSVSTNCGDELGEDCEMVRERAHSLATLLERNMIAEVAGEQPPIRGAIDSTLSEEEARTHARDVCGLRDFSGCVDEFMEHWESGQNLALCRSEHGSWHFEQPVGNIDDFCENHDFFVVSIIEAGDSTGAR